MSKLIPFVLVLVAACAAEPSTPANNGGVSGTGAGGVSGMSTGGGPRAPATGGGNATAGECTPDLAPSDEFFIPCEDAGPMVVPFDSGVPVADAHVEVPPVDAEVLPVPDAGLPPIDVPEGMCAERATSCDIGNVQTSVGSAICNIDGFALNTQTTICEVCDKATHLIDYNLTIMNCGGCGHVYSEGTTLFDRPVSAGSCESQGHSISLQWTAADQSCVDVYAYIGTGDSTSSGATVLARDQIRICRCDRTTDTCITCTGGACD